jgi:ferritin-like metal-binding protein YciE
MAKMTEPRELLLHELGDILYAENLLLKVLPQLSREATDKELKQGFDRHTRETKQQVENVKKAFKALGAPAKAEQCPGIEGIKKEHDEFVKEEKPDAAVLNAFLTGAASRTEHYEIAAYTGAITMARAMGEKQVVTLLERNLKQEKETLRKVETIARRLAKDGAQQAKQNGGTSRSKPKPTSSRRSTSSSRSSATRTRATASRSRAASSGRSRSSASRAGSSKSSRSRRRSS